jgi:hypothetical protein
MVVANSAYLHGQFSHQVSADSRNLKADNLNACYIESQVYVYHENH